MLFMECQSGRDHSFLKCPLKILFTQLGLRVICEVMAEAWTQALTIHFLFSTWLCIFYLPLSLVGYLSPSAHGTPTHLLCPLSPRPWQRFLFSVKAITMIEGKRPTDTSESFFKDRGYRNVQKQSDKAEHNIGCSQAGLSGSHNPQLWRVGHLLCHSHKEFPIFPVPDFLETLQLLRLLFRCKEFMQINPSTFWSVYWKTRWVKCEFPK